jgi:hypothetical protein
MRICCCVPGFIQRFRLVATSLSPQGQRRGDATVSRLVSDATGGASLSDAGPAWLLRRTRLGRSRGSPPTAGGHGTPDRTAASYPPPCVNSPFLMFNQPFRACQGLRMPACSRVVHRHRTRVRRGDGLCSKCNPYGDSSGRSSPSLRKNGGCLEGKPFQRPTGVIRSICY